MIGKELAVPECAHEWFPPYTPAVLAGRWSLKDFCQQVEVRIAPRSEWYQAAFPSCWAQQNKPASEPDLSFSKLFHIFCLRNHSSGRGECLAPHELSNITTYEIKWLLQNTRESEFLVLMLQ